MGREEILEKVQEVLREELDNPSISVSAASTASEVPGWDSLAHVQIVSAVEKAFGVRFTSREIFRWNNVGEMVESISSRK
jgi:acyl carrier protein